ncbi:hypothetical protein IAS59_000518 [Cryptococcus gattii]
MPAIARQLVARGYATAAAAVKAPLQLNSLTGTYATSTYLAALKKSPKDLEALAKDVEAFDKKIRDDAKLAAFIRTLPLFLPRSQPVQKTPPFLLPSDPPPSPPSSPPAPLPSSPTSSPSSPRTAVSRPHPRSLPTSTPSWLPTGSLNRLEKALKSTEIAQGKTLKVANRVNASVLGGLLVDFGDKTIDLSASSKVNRFNAALTQGV